jgi:type IX secretion system PorP/SprF family membrane protein
MRRIKVLLSLLSFLLAFGEDLYAQQDAQWSQYMFNSLYYNPGYAGTEGVIRATAIGRMQWLGYSSTNYGGGAPNTTILSLNAPLPSMFDKKINHGAGMYFLYDTKGPLTNIELQLSYSSHWKLGKGTLGVGLRGGFYSQKIDPSKYRVVDQNDPIYQYLNSNKANQSRPDGAAGIWYTQKKYYMGVSFDHVFRNNFNFGFDSITSRLANHMYITGGYNFMYGPLMITPTALIQSDLNELSYMFGPMVTYNEKFWVGLNLRESFAHRDESKKGKTLSNDDIVFLVGVNALKNKQGKEALRIGYSFDFVTSGLSAKKQTSHEIMLSYMIPSPFGGIKPKVRTPRYRHDEN